MVNGNTKPSFKIFELARIIYKERKKKDKHTHNIAIECLRVSHAGYIRWQKKNIRKMASQTSVS